MDGMWVQNIVAIIAVILIPMTGLTIILTTRLALKPLVETLAKVLQDSGVASSSELLSQISQLSEQVDSLTEHVQRLEEAQEFDRKLLEAPTDEVGMLR
jgi:hypothetical protein